MKEKLLSKLNSKVKIKVSGRNVNNFLKRLSRNKINIYKVIPKSYKECYLLVDYNSLSDIYKYKTIYDVTIKEYYGILRLLKSLKKNIIILSFIILGLIMIYTMSNVILKVEVIHSNKKIRKSLYEELEKYNIKKYSFRKDNTTIEKIEDKILKDNKDTLEWIEIIREGTKYIVRVEERIIKKEKQDDTIYDLVAAKRGVLKRIEYQSGEKIKNINTYVDKGEIIISSNITMPNGEIIKSNAKGKVLAEVWYNIEVDYPYLYNEIKYTGKKRKVLSLNILGKRLTPFHNKKYKHFKKDVKYIYHNNLLLNSLSVDTEYEIEKINKIYTYDEAIENAIEDTKKKLQDSNKNIKEISKVIITSESEKDKGVHLLLFVAVLEDITKYEVSKEITED